jgi:hypothetical protein
LGLDFRFTPISDRIAALHQLTVEPDLPSCLIDLQKSEHNAQVFLKIGVIQRFLPKTLGLKYDECA